MCTKKRKFKNIRRLSKKYCPNVVSLDRFVLACIEAAERLAKEKGLK